MTDGIHFPSFSPPSWIRDQAEADGLRHQFDLFHDWLLIEARSCAWVRSAPGGLSIGPPSLALRLTDGKKEVLLLFSAVLYQSLGHAHDFISRASITIRSRDGDVEARFDDMVVRGQGLSWSEGEFAPAPRLGPDVPTPDSHVADTDEAGWVLCPTCSDAWQTAWSSQRCPTCGNVIVLRPGSGPTA